MPKKTLEQEINEFLDVWDCPQLISFLKEIIPLCELYDVSDEDDWVRNEVGEGNEVTVRLIRTVYLISRIAEFHSGKLAISRTCFKNLWLRMKKEALIQ